VGQVWGEKAVFWSLQLFLKHQPNIPTKTVLFRLQTTAEPQELEHTLRLHWAPVALFDTFDKMVFGHFARKYIEDKTISQF
jgi:hypothetical protein